MCGVCGIISPRQSAKWRFDTLRKLLVLSQERGRDAAGVAFVENNKMVVLKDGCPAEEFVESREFLALKTKIPPVVMGHARGASPSLSGYNHHGTSALASAGKNVNNHPFYSSHSGIALIHNGRIDDEMWRETAGQEGGILHACDGETDSEVALRVLETFVLSNKSSMFENIENMCLNIAGKYVFVILKEDEPDTIWLVVHDNPLHISLLVKSQSIVFASTDSIIKKALKETKQHLNFFVEETSPKVIHNVVVNDRIVEIKLSEKGSFVIKTAEIDPPTEEYKYHVMAAEKEINKDEEALIIGQTK